ncbi:MAG: mechanosensitive ion channel family protein [Chloroflexi bacterium]|nr:mechanosensitive ion channel family protein [Chloroflexota bacterium]
MPDPDMPSNLVLNWLNESVIGIEIWQFIGIGVMAVIIVVARFAIIFALNQAITRRTPADRHEFWQHEVRRLQRPLLLMLGAITLAIGFPVLDFDPDVENVVEIFSNFASTFAGVLVGFRLVDAGADYWKQVAEETDSKLDDQLVPLARTSGKIFVGAIGAVFVLQNLDVNITSLIAGLGLGGLAVALAAQDTLKNLLGGATILADKPFQVGDWVIVGDIEGTVEQVGFRSTRIRTFADSLITVPNARMTDTAVNNMGQRTWRRYYTTVGIAYHTDPDRIQAFVEGIRATVRSNQQMRHDYYIVELHSFGASSLNIMVYTFIGASNWNEELRTRHVFNLDIIRLAHELQVEFAFPTQTLHIASSVDGAQEVPAPRERSDLGRTVDDFAPDGQAGQRSDDPITKGYDNG